jgi:hypothetical protein
MLEPQSYPELVARALVLDEEPFVDMADDDNPWVEGLLLVTTVGLFTGMARFVGGWLTAASLPDPNAVLTTLLDGWRQLAGALSIAPAAAEGVATQVWAASALLNGYTGGPQVTALATTPALLVIGWLFFGLLAFAVARAVGGQGSLSSTLGAAALMVAPQVLHLVSLVPFVAVSGLLTTVWGVLIGYRAVQVAHDLSWQKALVATLIPFAAAVAGIGLLGTAFALGFTAGGFR